MNDTTYNIMNKGAKCNNVLPTYLRYGFVYLSD